MVVTVWIAGGLDELFQVRVPGFVNAPVSQAQVAALNMTGGFPAVGLRRGSGESAGGHISSSTSFRG